MQIPDHSFLEIKYMIKLTLYQLSSFSFSQIYVRSAFCLHIQRRRLKRNHQAHERDSGDMASRGICANLISFQSMSSPVKWQQGYLLLSSLFSVPRAMNAQWKKHFASIQTVPHLKPLLIYDCNSVTITTWKTA